MTVKFYWTLDVAADPARGEPAARAVAGRARDVRPATITRYDYYAQIAQAAAQTAFDGLYLPFRPQADDSLIVAAAIARETPRLLLVPEFPVWSGSAVYAAKQAVSFQRQTHDRLGWAILAEADPALRQRDGDQLAEEDAPARLSEFLAVARGVHSTRPFTYAGAHFAVEQGGFAAPLDRAVFPPVFLHGDSEEALARSARLADIHVFPAAPLDVVRHQVEALERLAVRAGRSVGYGIVQPVLARDDGDEAREAAHRAGLAPTALVGDHDMVAERLATLAHAGIDHFVLTGPAALPDAYIVGQHVLPRFRAGAARAALAA